jgi:hypothetical protein
MGIVETPPPDPPEQYECARCHQMVACTELEPKNGLEAKPDTGCDPC